MPTRALLLPILLIWLLTSGCAGRGGAAVTEQNLELAVFRRVNAYRQARGLAFLVRNGRLAEQARLHSQAMARGAIPFGHDGFAGRLQEAAVPCLIAAENVAFNRGHADPVAAAVTGWLKSADHRANIEGRYDLTGIGVARDTAGIYYFTQIFALRSSP